MNGTARRSIWRVAWWQGGLIAVFLVTLPPGCEQGRLVSEAATYETPDSTLPLSAYTDGMLAPLPERAPAPTPITLLGRRLFFDRLLSEDQKVACADCHVFRMGGTNGQYRTTLPERGPTAVNVPTVFNLAYLFRFAWSGKFDDLGVQIDAAMKLPEAMATTWEATTARIGRSRSYRQAFKRTYADGLNEANVRDALVRYCLSLITPGSRFDEFLRGRVELNALEQSGYRVFREYGCVSCHQGINVGGNMYQKFGIMSDYFGQRKDASKADLGLFNSTGREEDRHVFRVPSLRNVALTAPYFHDGSAKTLEVAVSTMGRVQLGRELDDGQIAALVAFLGTLTGKMPESEAQ